LQDLRRAVSKSENEVLMVKTKEIKPDIRGLQLDELKALLVEAGEKPFRATQIFRWVHESAVQDWHEMKNIGEQTRHILNNIVKIEPLKIRQERISKDGTRKYLWELNDANLIETVLLSHSGDITRNRNTLCLSTQVGCAMACNFCATGTMGFSRNLGAGEILSQALDILRIRQKEDPGFKIHNLVYMGMGEPLLNLSAVLKSIRIFNSNEGQKIGIRRITVSTCGLVPQIDILAEEKLDIVLAISLHAPNNEMRDMIMPVNKQYPLEKLIPACQRYIEKTNRRITFEYALIKGMNDKEEHAQQLASLLQGLHANLNLIPINSHPNSKYKRPELVSVKYFSGLLKKKGLNVVIREEKGSDIEAACGQLAGKER